ncbi:MAG: discoidin domain-containing protein [Acidimicrobiales bacterium]|nr:discoidin domain-containing protein [Acidimicrobiales bacterium]
MKLAAASRRNAASALAAVAAVATLCATSLATGNAVASSPQIAGSVPAPSPSEISPVCVAPDASGSLGPAASLPSNPTSTVLTPPGGVSSFTATSTGIYVNTGSTVVTYSLTGSPIGSFALPPAVGARHGLEVTQPEVDPSGNIYVASYYDQVVDKFSPTGQLLWSVDPELGNPVGIFSMGSGSGFQLAVSLFQKTTGSDLLDLSTGAVMGAFPLSDRFGHVSRGSNGNLLYSGDGYVESLDSTGRVLSRFGSSRTGPNGVHTGSGSQFYYAAQVVQGPDGTIYSSDPLHTIESTGPQGFLQGTTTLNDTLDLGGYNLYLVGSTIYYQGGPPFNGAADNISSVSLPTLNTYLRAVHLPSHSLGWGAGLSSSAAANYFAPGTTPGVTASFDPWWSAQASHLQLSYSVEDTSSLTAETVPAATTIALPTSASGLANIPLTIPSIDQQPGPYLVQASLSDTATSPPTRLGTTCMPYTVGAPGDGLNLAGLAAGIGGGGPTDPRGVVLNSQLGLDGKRGATVDWSTFLPNCSASSPSAATCGPSAMDFTNASADYFKAAALAQADHVTFWVQVSGGSFGSVPTALVQGGWWHDDVARLVRYYSSPPPGCGQCAPVTMWEPWNESNNTGWNNANEYVSEVLQPFYSAVKSVEPGTGSTVIGGSSLDVSIGWWQQLIGAGGLNFVDAASIHPYPGNNDSFEEWGNIPQIRELQTMLAGKPLWFTEIGWWSDGDYNFLNQANMVSRAMIWQKVLNIPVWSYFYNEGNWGNDGVSFSLIQAGSVDDYVKPAALATMTTANQVAGRPYLTMPATGIPQTYEATFGPGSGQTSRLAALWSDGLTSTGSVTVTAPGGGSIPVTVTSQYGQATAATVASGSSYSLPISDQITYVSYPVGDSLTVGPTESYGTDLAAASGGANATASSGDASAAIAGTTTGAGWSSTSGDTAPSLTVTLASPQTINRVVVDTQSVGSTAPSVRNYVLSVDQPGVGWVPVATVIGQYRTHSLQLAFNAVTATAVRISVSEVNFGGYYGGGVPPWWSPTQPAGAFLHALQVYGGTGTTSQVSGSALTPLISGGPGSPPPTTTTPPPTGTTAPAPATTTPTTGPPPQPTSPPGGASDAPSHVSSMNGYWLTTSDGGVYSFGHAGFYGSAGGLHLDMPMVGMATTRDGRGYRLVASDGGIFTFGDAGYLGSAGGLPLNKPIVGMASAPDGNGYWLVASDGGIFAFGDAAFYGSTGALSLKKPIVHMVATPDGRGYWLVASDGGIFSFGDAAFYGSTGALSLNKPIVSMAASPDGRGYWLVATDGGIFTFGDAQFHGSTGALSLNKPITGMASTPDGQGYWLVATDGGIFSFGDATFFGSAGGLGLSKPAVSIS